MKTKHPLIFKELCSNEKDLSLTISQWLEQAESKLRGRNYNRYNQKQHGSTFQYSRTVWSNEINMKKIYIISVLFYDWRIIANELGRTDIPERIGISYEVTILTNDRCDLLISSDKVDLDKVEEIAKKFYESITPFFKSL
jgi:hypothetical protein